MIGYTKVVPQAGFRSRTYERVHASFSAHMAAPITDTRTHRHVETLKHEPRARAHDMRARFAALHPLSLSLTHPLCRYPLGLSSSAHFSLAHASRRACAQVVGTCAPSYRHAAHSLSTFAPSHLSRQHLAPHAHTPSHVFAGRTRPLTSPSTFSHVAGCRMPKAESRKPAPESHHHFARRTLPPCSSLPLPGRAEGHALRLWAYPPRSPTEGAWHVHGVGGRGREGGRGEGGKRCAVRHCLPSPDR